MRKPTGIDVLRFVIYSLISSYGVVFLCSLLELTVGIPFGSQNRFLDYMFFGPTFAVPVIIGLVFGYRFGNGLATLYSRLLFVMPLFIAVWEIGGWMKYRYSGENLLASIVDNFFTSRCGGSECLEELMITAPLLSSLAWIFGSELRWLCTRLRKPRP